MQEKFVNGQARIIVATIAFGMGIDKPDIRWIILYNLPASLESYVQMVGRAGRDGQRSLCLLFFSKADAASLRRFSRQDIPSVENLRSVYRQLRDRSDEGVSAVTSEHLQESAQLRDKQDPRVLVGMLEKCQLVSRSFDSGRAICVKLLQAPGDSLKRIEALLKRYETQAQARCNKIIDFVESPECRHQQVAKHFGERVQVPCGLCDVCIPRPRAAPSERGSHATLPASIADAIFDAIEQLPWALGHKGLVATLRGATDAPPSAQKSAGFGVLAAADHRSISRWLGELLDNGNLQAIETGEDFKFKAIRLRTRRDPPSLSSYSPSPFPGYVRSSVSAPGRSFRERGGASLEREVPDQEAFQRFEKLRSWRLGKAQELNVPAFIVANDKLLHAIAVGNPDDLIQLGSIWGFGPKKTATFGMDILAVLHESTDRCR